MVVNVWAIWNGCRREVPGNTALIFLIDDQRESQGMSGRVAIIEPVLGRAPFLCVPYMKVPLGKKAIMLLLAVFHLVRSKGSQVLVSGAGEPSRAWWV